MDFMFRWSKSGKYPTDGQVKWEKLFSLSYVFWSFTLDQIIVKREFKYPWIVTDQKLKIIANRGLILSC